MRIVLLLIAFGLFSCGNKKAEIVEREKEIKKELEIQIALQDSLEILVDNSKQSKGTELMDLGVEIINSIHKQESLKASYDSLEMELKKY